MADADQAMWMIVSSERSPELPKFRSWLYRLQSEGGADHLTEVRATATTLAGSNARLSEMVAGAKQSDGQSVIETLVSWSRPPKLVEVTSEWITIHHANGRYSRIGFRLPDDPTRRLGALVDRAKIHVPFGQGVEHVHEYVGRGHWVLNGIQSARLRF